MDKNVEYLEDCLELLAGLKKSDSNFQMNSSDTGILSSIARQVFKGTALTDRQYALVREKLETGYVEQFLRNGYSNFGNALGNLRMPMREIDRTKIITIVSHEEMVGPNTPYETYKQSWQWIKVRFPFSKKDIVKIENIANTANRFDYHHVKGSHEHYFILSEKLVFGIVNAFKDSQFKIDQELLDIYQELLEFNKNYDSYLPGVYDYELKNTYDVVAQHLEDSLGKPCVDNLLLYKDRSLMYNLQIFDDVELAKSSSRYSNLAVQIAMRNSGRILVDSKTRNIQSLIDALIELERFPILVLCDYDRAEEQLVTTHQIFRNRVLDSEISVMFRLEGEHEFNRYVREKQLNNYVDRNTKVVYIDKSKLAKPLLTADWQHNCVLSLTSLRPSTKVASWLEGCDLVVNHDTDETGLAYRLGYYGSEIRTEKIS